MSPAHQSGRRTIGRHEKTEILQRKSEFGEFGLMSIILEVCIDGVDSGVAAHTGGADRVELCSALREGGVTPSAGLIHAVRSAIPLSLSILIRPRAGDFCYTASEFKVMCDDVRRARDLGADGVVIGILRKDGAVDLDRTRELIALARPMKVTFNRAFDASKDLDRSLEDVITTGADRILTSGGQCKGMDGTTKIAQLVKAAQDRIILLGGGGIRHSNVLDFIRSTGVREIHTSLRTHVGLPASERSAGLIFGEESNHSSRYVITDRDVLKIRHILDSIDVAKQPT